MPLIENIRGFSPETNSEVDILDKILSQLPSSLPGRRGMQGILSEIPISEGPSPIKSNYDYVNILRNYLSENTTPQELRNINEFKILSESDMAGIYNKYYPNHPLEKGKIVSGFYRDTLNLEKSPGISAGEIDFAKSIFRSDPYIMAKTVKHEIGHSLTGLNPEIRALLNYISPHTVWPSEESGFSDKMERFLEPLKGEAKSFVDEFSHYARTNSNEFAADLYSAVHNRGEELAARLPSLFKIGSKILGPALTAVQFNDILNDALKDQDVLNGIREDQAKQYKIDANTSK